MLTVRLLPLLALISSPFAAAIEPGEPMDVSKIIMRPKAWEEGGHEMKMVPWLGRNIAFLTISDDLDKKVMSEFIGHLDDAWDLYAKVTGRSPRSHKTAAGKPTIIALPADNLTCGYGCGYVGATGIEMTHFYKQQLPLLQANSKAIPHCYFYEMGRNYYTFGAKHSSFTTGFAVFMRYVCIDTLKLVDAEAKLRNRIEHVIEEYEKSDLPFFDTFTIAYGTSEKKPRIKGHPSDQPVMYASAMLKLRRELGDEWVSRFFRQLATCPDNRGESKTSARNQSLAWYIAASTAAGKDLAPLFVEKWRLPLPDKAKKVLADVKWAEHPEAGSIVEALLKSGAYPESVE